MKRGVERWRADIRQSARSEDEEIRRHALEHALQLPSDEALPLLLEGLGDPSWRVRKVAIERLVAAPSGWLATEAVIEALADGDNAGRRNAAVEALTRCGERVIPLLLDATHNRDVDVRKLVVDVLGGIASQQAASRLVEMLADRDPNVRAAAAESVGALGGPRVQEALLDRARDAGEDELVRLAAVRALGRLGAPLRVTDLAGVVDHPILRAAALALLGRTEDPEAPDRLLEGLESPARSTREGAIEGFLRTWGRLDPEARAAFGEGARAVASRCPELVAAAIEGMEHGELGTRIQLAQFLGILGPGGAVLPLLGAAQDDVLCEVAIEALVQMGDTTEPVLAEHWAALPASARRVACEVLARTAGEAGRILLHGALDDPSAEVRPAAARAVASRGEAEALPVLARRLRDCEADAAEEGTDERDAVVQALIAIALSEPSSGASARAWVVELLSDALTSPSEHTRVAVAQVLAALGRAEDAPRLELLVQDPSPAVRREALEALAHADPGRAREPLRLALADESPDVRGAAALGLPSVEGPDALEDLERLLDDPDETVRAAAVAALGETLPLLAAGSDRRTHALGLLERALTDAGVVALASLAALQRGGAEGARLALALLSHADAELVQIAARCVARCGDRESLAELVPLVGHPAWSVRAEVVAALAERGMVVALPTLLRRLDVEQDEFVRQALLQAISKLEP